MVRKKVEGNEEQRRAAARRARREGETPSVRKETTGASKQRSHLPRHESHETKLAAVHQGKQEWQASREAGADLRDPAAREPERSFAGGESADYTAAHERVFSALTDAQRAHGGEGVYLDEVARASGRAADGGDAPSGRTEGTLAASQHLANPPHCHPTASEWVLCWIAARVAADRPMRDAAARARAGLRQSLPHRLDPVRPAGRTPGAGCRPIRS
jgi:hypothetical protein